MVCLRCASNGVTHVMPDVSLAIPTLGNYHSILASEEWRSRRDPPLAQEHNLEVKTGYAVRKLASRECTFKTPSINRFLLLPALGD